LGNQMSATKGNRFWEARSSHGRKPIFASPDELWAASCEYFVWVEENPLWSNKVTQYQGAPVDVPEAKMRAMTKEGLCLFLDIDPQTWENYKAKQDFFGIVTRVEAVIYQQKFSGAAAELLNPNIIARDLGLKDASAVEHSGNVDINKMSDEELNNKLLALLNESPVAE
jgi:hypothetical protein